MVDFKKLSEIEELTKPIDGFLSQNGRSQFEGEVLYHLALKSKGKIVEIGSWKGKSTIWLGKGTEAGSKQSIYAIDPHTDSEEHRSDGEAMWTFDAFKENISHADVAKYVVPIVKPPLESLGDVPGRVGMIFLDGTHDYEKVKQEFNAWLPKVQIGGIVAFHDSFGNGVPGVRRLVHEEVFRSPIFKDVRYINGITYATKVDQTTLSERLRNRLSLFVKIVHEKSHDFPQPLRSLSKFLIWGPFQKKWLKDLDKTSIS
jgi:predicted O-methyltransferase YrrM